MAPGGLSNAHMTISQIPSIEATYRSNIFTFTACLCSILNIFSEWKYTELNIFYRFNVAIRKLIVTDVARNWTVL